jgi:mono/diheme cytochrome c family protein
MRTYLTFWLICMALIAWAGKRLDFPQSIASAQTSAAESKTGEVGHGRYLVEEIAKCAECHTPRTDNGTLDRTRWLQGASIWIEPIQHFSNWGDRAPALAGLPGYSDEQMIRVLEKGVGLNGKAIQPPMHEYHMNPTDSRAVIAYLRSLPSTRQ